MILYSYLGSVPTIVHGISERLAQTDLSMLGMLLGCLVVFRVLTVKRKPKAQRVETTRPAEASERKIERNRPD